MGTISKGLYISISRNDDQATIHLDGHFTFSSHSKFKDAYLALIEDCHVRSISVDFAQVERLDSAALGMLLLFRERIQDTGKTLTLGKRSHIVEKTFEVANFHQLFTVV